MKTIVIGDIHGCYNELKELIFDLEQAGEYNKKKDKLVFLGDYIDRGKDSRLVVKFIRDLQKNNKRVIALMGNHEDMLIDYYDKKSPYIWKMNGGNETLNSYEGNMKQFADDIEWMRNLPLYYEDKHFIYVHAGIDLEKDMDEQDRNTLLWIRDPFIYNTKKYNKRVVFGHTPTDFLNGGDEPLLTYNNNIAIDTGCVYGGALSALIIEHGEANAFYRVFKHEEKKETKMYY